MYQWHAADYATHSCGQERWARELLADITLQECEQVLDVGCGDGRITADLARRIPQGQVVGVDLSADMIAHATAQFSALPNLSFQQADASCLPFDNTFTLVFSNAALHWVRDHRPVLAGVSRALKPGGRFIAQMGGAGNGAELIAVLDAVRASAQWRGYFVDFVSSYGFHHPDAYLAWLQAVGLHVEQCQLLVKDMLHADRHALRGWLRTAWHPYTSPVPAPQREQFIDAVLQRYLQAHPLDASGQAHVRMVRLQVRASKAAS